MALRLLISCQVVDYLKPTVFSKTYFLHKLYYLCDILLRKLEKAHCTQGCNGT